MIPEWNSDDAEKRFLAIERGTAQEWVDLEWKRTLEFNDTGNAPQSNTTQKVMCALANTEGGVLVIGFENNGTFVGYEHKENIENYLYDKVRSKIHPGPPQFKVRYYPYKNKEVLVIFVDKSLEPLRCDNGVYYGRQQSQCIPMQHAELQKKFITSSDQQKYIKLVLNEIHQLEIYSKTLVERANNGRQGTMNYNLKPFVHHLEESSDKLYFFYEENGLLQKYNEVMHLLKYWIAAENRESMTFGHAITLHTLIEEFKKVLVMKTEK